VSGQGREHRSEERARSGAPRGSEPRALSGQGREHRSEERSARREPATAPTSAGEAEAHPHTHSDVSGGWLRAAVFGAMDGLVTNTALVAGVGGGGASPRAIVLAGVASLAAGAISMALGEYTSVRTQNEQLDLEVAKERRELEVNPHGELAELVQVLEVRGVERGLAERVAAQLSRDPDVALRLHVVAEMGVSIEDRPSPWTAAVSSFLTFAIGAVVPLLPYLLGFSVLWAALLCGGLGLVVAGALSSRFTPRPWWYAAGRQLLFGAAAAGVTYAIGLAIGVSVA
jgi:vacuolar iron transporter family protein